MNIEQLQDAAQTDVSRETFEVLLQMVDLIRHESTRQNLISAGTVADIWTRHVLDSVQLLRYSGQTRFWLDLGTGAGFPGLVIAACLSCPVTLIEERRLRHEFLAKAASSLGLKNIQVIGNRLERVEAFPVTTISARAFAPLEKILALSYRFSNENTTWVLPKGRKAHEELASVRTTWHGDFRLEPSMTDPTSSIIIAKNVSPKDRL